MTMRVLSPSKLFPIPAPHGGGAWFRLARTSDGILCLERVLDAVLHVLGTMTEWAFVGDVPPHIARQLEDDDDPDQVARVLDRAVRVLGYA